MNVYALALKHGDRPPPEHWFPYEDEDEESGVDFRANAVRGQVFHHRSDCSRIRVKRDLTVPPSEEAASRVSPVTRRTLYPCGTCYPSDRGEFGNCAQRDAERPS